MSLRSKLALGPLGLLSIFASGCPDDTTEIDCARIAVPLLSRCDQRFSKAEPWRCLSTYAGDDTARFMRADAFTVRLCQVSAPQGDNDCYESATCQEIETFACANPDSLRARIDETCRMACEQAVVSCQVPCTAAGSADACETCVVDCESERLRCFERCPLAPVEG
jgi:hypothetical protein